MGTGLLFEIFLVILALFATCYGQECDPKGVSCINCTDYQQCSGGAPVGPIFSCRNGVECGEEPLLEYCWTRLNCYALNECTGVGIFPDVMLESNYFVCLPDSGSGFLKYDFTCPEGEYFDKKSQMCVSRAVTSETTLSPDPPLTPDTTSTAPTPAPSPETTSTTPTPAPSPETTSTTPTLAPTPETTSTTSTPAPTPDTTTTTPTPMPTPETTTTTPTPVPTPETTTTTSTPVPTPETTTTTSTPVPTPETTTTTSTPVPTPDTTSTTPTPAPTSMPTTPPPFACTFPGIFPNPTNCKMYFRCSTSLKVFNYTCPGTSYFNENILKCSLIITPACQQQILQNTTTSTTQLTTTSTTTTTTPAPTQPPKTTTAPTSTTTTTTTTTKTPPPTQPPTTTTQAPSTPFSCTAAGTFENPLDCRSYYRCSSTGRTFLYVCPGGSYYNEFTRRCGLTITPRCKSKLGG